MTTCDVKPVKHIIKAVSKDFRLECDKRLIYAEEDMGIPLPYKALRIK